MIIRTVLGPLRRSALFALLLSPAAGCAHHADAVTLREVSAPSGLRYGFEIDATRISRGTGLAPVPAVAKLLEENLVSYFRVMPAQAAPSDTHHEIVAEAPAPGYGVHAVIEARPDDFCHVSIDVVTLKGGKSEVATLAPYSVHYGLAGVRMAMSALRGPNRPPLAVERFDLLRKQATELADKGQDPPIDDSEFARTARPLERLDEAPRYYAPVKEPSTVRPD